MAGLLVQPLADYYTVKGRLVHAPFGPSRREDGCCNRLFEEESQLAEREAGKRGTAARRCNRVSPDVQARAPAAMEGAAGEVENRVQHERRERLGNCTEELGSESSTSYIHGNGGLVSTSASPTRCGEREAHSSCGGREYCSRPAMHRQKMARPRADFPPPLPSLVCEDPPLMRSVKGDGRFLLQKVANPAPRTFRATREAGRLRLELVFDSTPPYTEEEATSGQARPPIPTSHLAIIPRPVSPISDYGIVVAPAACRLRLELVSCLKTACRKRIGPRSFQASVPTSRHPHGTIPTSRFASPPNPIPRFGPISHADPPVPVPAPASRFPSVAFANLTQPDGAPAAVPEGISSVLAIALAYCCRQLYHERPNLSKRKKKNPYSSSVKKAGYGEGPEMTDGAAGAHTQQQDGLAVLRLGPPSITSLLLLHLETANIEIEIVGSSVFHEACCTDTYPPQGDMSHRNHASVSFGHHPLRSATAFQLEPAFKKLLLSSFHSIHSVLCTT